MSAIRPRMSELEVAMLRQLTLVRFATPVQELPFCPTRRWRFDFAWPEFKVALEIEGGTWVQGRHSRGAGMAKDAEKYNTAALMGWLVIRVTADQIKSGQALGWIEDALKLRRLHARQ